MCKYDICYKCIDIAMKQERSVKWFVKGRIPDFEEVGEREDGMEGDIKREMERVNSS